MIAYWAGFLDLSKAFDTLDDNVTMFNKLFLFGFPPYNGSPPT